MRTSGFASSTGPREGYAADEKLRDPHFCNIVADSWRFGFRSSSFFLLERICVRGLVAATDLQALDHMMQYLDRSRGNFCR